MSTDLIFLLGNTPDLSLAEIHSVLPGSHSELLLPDVARVSGISESILSNPSLLIDKLGGTVKILSILEEGLTHLQAADLENWLINFPKDASTRFKFAVGEIGRDHLPPLNSSVVKKTLENQGILVRYYAGSRLGLSASVLNHKKDIHEFIFIQDTKGNITVAQTLATQDIDSWTFRDRSKPYADRKKGMLPPKLARMMVNIALGERIWQADNQDALLYDPFCGSGTILLEAAEVAEIKLAASDLDVRAVLGTKENITWLSEKEQFDPPLSLVTATGDASRIKLDQLSAQKIDFLVTEPFLGKQTPKPEQLAGIFRGLEKLYLGAFKNWTSLLKPDARLVVVFPLVEDAASHKTFSLLNTLLDKLTSLGYNMSSQPTIYARPDAVVKRQIAEFTFRKP